MDASVFEFAGDIVKEVSQNAKGVERAMSGDSKVVTFGETFFDQFFADLGHSIVGFSSAGRRRAIEYAQEMGAQGAAIRILIVAYEEFCDLHKDVKGNYDGSNVLYQQGIELVLRIVRGAQKWATERADEMSSRLLPAIEKALMDLEELT